MPQTYDCTDPQGREEGLTAAVAAVKAGRLVVIPTDTVYGIGADDEPAGLHRGDGGGQSFFSPLGVGAVVGLRHGLSSPGSA